MLVTKEFRFEAAHFLPNHQGQCRRLHGHSYIVYAVVEGTTKRVLELPDAEEGMVLDFGTISSIMKPLIAQLDHILLNDVLPVPTAERLAIHLYGALYQGLLTATSNQYANAAAAKAVRVYETATSCVEANFSDWYNTPEKAYFTVDDVQQGGAARLRIASLGTAAFAWTDRKRTVGS